MIATNTDQQPPYLYGEIFSLYQAPPPELPGIGRFLSQGAAAGAFAVVVAPLPAASPDATPAWESSKTTQEGGSTPRSSAARR